MGGDVGVGVGVGRANNHTASLGRRMGGEMGPICALVTPHTELFQNINFTRGGLEGGR